MIRFLTLAFLCLFIASACNKQENILPEEIIPNPPEQVIIEIDSTQRIFQKNIVETQSLLIEIFVTVLKNSIVRPDLNGLQGSYVDTRSCPNPSVVDNGGDGFDKTLILLFNEDGSNCDVGGIIYSGELVVEFEAALGDTDADEPDIQLSGVNNFVVNGYAFDLTGGTIDLNRSGGAGTYSYDYTINGSAIKVTKGDISTSLPVGTSGTFSLLLQAGDDPNNPADWFDNPFCMSVNDALVRCENNATLASSTFCVDTEEDIKFEPQVCACPKDGIIRIKDNNGDCSDPINNQNSTQYDFGDGTCANAGSVTEQARVIEFLSYEGVFTAGNDIAAGVTSYDVLVMEDNNTLTTESIQRKGTGSFATDFTWTAPSQNSKGTLNDGQTLLANNSSLLPWINEFHYFDDSGGGANGFIEIAGPAGTDLSQYQIILYNGSGGNAYSNVVLTGVIDDEMNGFGAVFVDENGIQNANGNAPDGIALVKLESTQVLNFCN